MDKIFWTVTVLYFLYIIINEIVYFIKKVNSKNRFESIGLDIKNKKTEQKFINENFKKGTELVGKDGKYFYLTEENGIEFWFPWKDEKIVGVEPFFSGKSEIEILFDENFEEKKFEVYLRPTEKFIESYQVLCKKTEDEVIDEEDDWSEKLFCSCTKSIIDIPNVNLFDKDKMVGTVKKMSLTVFAEKINVYENEEAVQKKKSDFDKMDFSCIGLYYIYNRKQNEKKGTSYSRFSGVVRDFRKIKNEMTGKNFYWIFLELNFGLVDLVVYDSPKLNDLKIGTIVSGYGWLSGKFKTDF